MANFDVFTCIINLFATYPKNSLYPLATPCKNRTSQPKKPAETGPRMRSIELFVIYASS